MENTVERIDASALASECKGPLLLPGDDKYDAVRKIWNAAVDNHPALIARCIETSDVAAAIRFARDNDLEIGVRCGGHSVIGYSVPDGGLMIDLSLMNKVRVDPEKQLAYAEGGALLRSLDQEAQAHDLATTAGNVSHTGVGGLTLAGGMGWLARRFGLACDNVTSFELVTAEGEVIRASATENPELGWGLRGGGGNFGVVTEFVFQLHPMKDTAICADMYFEMDQAEQALRQWRNTLAKTPREATLGAWTGIAGEWPFLPKEHYGKQLVRVGYVWVGDQVEGEAFLSQLQGDLSPVAQHIQKMSYLELQSMDDSTREEYGRRRYWKGFYFDEFSDEAIRAFISLGVDSLSSSDPGFRASASLQQYGGAIADTGDEETAFSHRNALCESLVATSWIDQAEDESRIAAARRFAAALAPFTSGAYVNTAGSDKQSDARSVYGENKLQRLRKLKSKYDPYNIFHRNANITPLYLPRKQAS